MMLIYKRIPSHKRACTYIWRSIWYSNTSRPRALIFEHNKYFETNDMDLYQNMEYSIWENTEGCFFLKGFHRGDTAKTKHLYNIYTMLYQRSRRWADIV